MNRAGRAAVRAIAVFTPPECSFRFIFLLRRARRSPVSITELLNLARSAESGLWGLECPSGFLLPGAHLSGWKDERYYDRYEQGVPAAHFKGAEDLFALLQRDCPEDWLAKMAIAKFTDAEEGGESTALAAGRN